MDRERGCIGAVSSANLMKHHGALHSGTDAKLRNNTGKSTRVPCTQHIRVCTAHPYCWFAHTRFRCGSARSRRGQRLANTGDVMEDFGATAEGDGGRAGRYVGEKLSSEVSSWVARSNLIQLS